MPVTRSQSDHGTVISSTVSQDDTIAVQTIAVQTIAASVQAAVDFIAVIARDESVEELPAPLQVAPVVVDLTSPEKEKIVQGCSPVPVGATVELSGENVHFINGNPVLLPFSEFTPSPVSTCTFSPSPYMHTRALKRMIVNLQEGILRAEQDIRDMRENACRLQAFLTARDDAAERTRSREERPDDRNVRARRLYSEPAIEFPVGRMCSADDTSTSSTPDLTADATDTVPNSPEVIDLE